MMFALGAATSLIDTLQSLTASGSSSASSQAQSQAAANPFQLGASPQTSATPTTGFSAGTSGYSAISPQTMSALLDAQSQSGTTSSTSTSTSPSDGLQNLFNDIDSNGDGSITKSEFESALGAGGTNTAAADKVFGELDTNGDGSVSMAELKTALQGAGGHHGGHHHMHASSGSGDSTSSTDPSTDPLLQAFATSTSTSGSTSGSTDLASTLNILDKSQLQGISLNGTSSASSSYMLTQALAHAEQSFSNSVSSSLSVNV
jgi:hypothetical protein